MKRIILLTLACARLYANPSGMAFVVEREDSGMKSVTVVHLEKNGTWTLQKIGAFGLVPQTQYAFVFNGVTTTEGQLFETVATSMNRNMRSREMKIGLLSRVTKEWRGDALTAVAPFSKGEAIGWDGPKQAFVLLTADSWDYISQNDALGNRSDFYDVSIGRIGDSHVVVLGRFAPQAPTVGMPYDYTMFLFHLEANRQVKLVSQKMVLKKVVGSIPLILNTGVFYESADAKGSFLAHTPMNGALDRSAGLKKFVVPHGTPIVPLAHGGGVYDAHVWARMGDDLRELESDSGKNNAVSNGLFADDLAAVTKTNQSHGPVMHRITGLAPVYRSYHTTTYAAAVGEDNTGVLEGGKVDEDLATKLGKKFTETWRLVHPADPGAKFPTQSLTILLAQEGMKADWLYQLIMELSDAQRTAYHLQKAGFPLVEIGIGTEIDKDKFLKALAGVAKCGAILAQ